MLDSLSEAGTLDELGIAPIRDGFANLFFPGTSTIQTRAKYYLIVPYAFKDMENNRETNPNQMLRDYDDVEKVCAKILLENAQDSEGIIGNRALAQNHWVKRTPSDIYWSGLRSYGIFSGGNISLSEYVRVMCALKKQKNTLMELGKRSDQAEEFESDDKDSGAFLRKQFWKIPTYSDSWKETLNIRLTPEEGSFLKRQILTAYPNSMMGIILSHKMIDAFQCGSFENLQSMIFRFPEQIQYDYYLALAFSRFLYVLRVLYNIMVSAGENNDANSEWGIIGDKLSSFSDVDLEGIIARLGIHGYLPLCSFLKNSRKLMCDNDVEGLKFEIQRREKELKKNRAKTLYPGQFDPQSWLGGKLLDYRFGNAKVIIKDIFESEGVHVEST